MNLTSLLAAVRTRLGVPDTDAFFTDIVLTDLVNASLESLSAQHDFYWLESSESLNTTEHVETVATSSSSQRTIALFDSTGVQLEYLPMDRLVRFPKDAESDTLRFFGYRGSTLVLRPVPATTVSGALTHIYRGVEPRLTGGSDTPLMPSQFHDAIADRAAYLANMRQGDLETAKGYSVLAAEWIEKMIDHSDRFSDSQGGGARINAAGNEG